MDLKLIFQKCGSKSTPPLCCTFQSGHRTCQRIHDGNTNNHDRDIFWRNGTQLAACKVAKFQMLTSAYKIVSVLLGVCSFEHGATERNAIGSPCTRTQVQTHCYADSDENQIT